MHTVIAGCGRVGSELAVRLIETGATVAIIDKEGRAFNRLPEGWSGQTLRGYGFDRDVLTEAGIERAGAFAAVTSGDNSNILAARIAHENFQVPCVVARIYDPRRAAIYQRLGIATVASAWWTTEQVMRRMFPAAWSVDWNAPGGTLTLIEVDLPEVWAGHALHGLDVPHRVEVVAVTRSGQARMMSDALLGQEGDLLHLLVHPDAHEELATLLATGPDHA